MQDLAAVSCVHDACGTVDGAAEVVAIGVIGDAGVHAATHAQREARGGAVVRERNLRRDGRDDRIAGVGERCVHAIAGRLHDDAMVALDRLAKDPVVAGKRRLHPLRLRFPQTAAAFDVGEKEGRDGGLFDHGGPLAPFAHADKDRPTRGPRRSAL